MKMKLRTEQGGRRWVASIPEIPDLEGYGSTRLEAVAGVTARALHVLADRIETGDVDVENIHIESMGKDNLVELVAAILKELQGSQIPNAETIAAMKELETNGGDSCSSIEELLARLNADD
jgi:hypothetical protein